MLSKGHHFPQVTLVVAADGDLGLNLPDYRAAERTFQLLVQAAGRAGRGEKPGRVLIQTRDAEHYCWQYVRDGNAEGFYAGSWSVAVCAGIPLLCVSPFCAFPSRPTAARARPFSERWPPSCASAAKP